LLNVSAIVLTRQISETRQRYSSQIAVQGATYNTMEPIIDFLAEELKAAQRRARYTPRNPSRTMVWKESTKARKAAKNERMQAMMNNLIAARANTPIVDFLASGD
jgi:hypothetical protein